MIYTIKENIRYYLDQIVFDDERNCFIVSNQELNLKITFPYYFEKSNGGVPFSNEDVGNYSMYILYKEDCPENSIFQVYEKSLDMRIGWIFPMRALISNEHDFVNNPHFSRYAFIAFSKFLTSDLFEYSIELEEGLENLQINNLVNENSMFLVVSHSNMQDYEFNLNEFLPSLFQYGYFFKNLQYTREFIVPQARINLQKNSDDLTGNEFIKVLITDLVFERHSLLKFFAIYQIIELLIEKILLSELDHITEGIEQKRIYTREIRERIAKFEAEKDRISKLFNEYTQDRDLALYHDLKGVCDDFLNLIGKGDQIPANFFDSLYLVRNFIIHDYRNLPLEANEVISNINTKFEDLMIFLILNFRRV